MRNRLFCLALVAAILVIMAVPSTVFANGQHGEPPQPEPETPVVLPVTGADAGLMWILLAAGASALLAGSVLRAKRAIR